MRAVILSIQARARTAADAVTTIYAPAELSKSRHAKRRRNARSNGEFSHVVGKVLFWV